MTLTAHPVLTRMVGLGCAWLLYEVFFRLFLFLIAPRLGFVFKPEPVAPINAGNPSNPAAGPVRAKEYVYGRKDWIAETCVFLSCVVVYEVVMVLIFDYDGFGAGFGMGPMFVYRLRRHRRIELIPDAPEPESPAPRSVQHTPAG